MTVPRAKEDLITKRLPAGVSTLRGAGAGRGVQEKYALSDLSDKLQFTHLSAQAHERRATNSHTCRSRLSLRYMTTRNPAGEREVTRGTACVCVFERSNV